MNEAQSFVETASMGYFMLTLVICMAVCSICDFLEFGIKQLGERRSVNNPPLNELMKSYRMLGMRGSTYSLIKGIVFAGLLAFAIIAGKPSLAALFANWFS